ncbi:MAG: TerB family tellurite resistance protein [Pirellulales bacterium]
MDSFDRLKNLAVMSAADGSLSENEIALLVDRCHELGLTEEHLEKAIAFALSRQATMALPTDLNEQESVLEDLIRMMAADGQLAESEKRLFALVAAKMSFPTERLDSLIDRLVKSVGKK